MIIIENRWHIFRLRCTRLFSPATHTHTHTYAQAKQVNIFKSVIALKGKCKSTVEIYFLNFFIEIQQRLENISFVCFSIASIATNKKKRERKCEVSYFTCAK